MGASVLPDDGVADGEAGGLVPEYGGFALVGDSECGDVIGGDFEDGEDFCEGQTGVFPDFHGIVFDVSGGGEDLAMVSFGGGHQFSIVIEDRAVSENGVLIKGNNIARARHVMLLFGIRVTPNIPKLGVGRGVWEQPDGGRLWCWLGGFFAGGMGVMGRCVAWV